MAQIVIEDQKDFKPLPDISEDMNYEVPPLDIDIYKTDDSRKRRFSVSAESSDDKKVEKFVKKIYPKSKEAIQRIRNSASGVFLFEGLDKEQSQLLIDAMFEKKVQKNDDIVTQGDRGDYFYVIENGIYEVWKSENIKLHSKPRKVFTYNNKGAFGELALMYNSPRAATVRSVTSGILWAVDRSTFRHIIVGCTSRKRKKYDLFLKNVALLLNVNDQTRAGIADILETKIYKKNDYIIKEGDDGDVFYFVQRGTVIVTQNTSQNGTKEKTVRTLHNGDFFGERALLLNDARSANVMVESATCECAAMDCASFMRLLGPMYDKFRMHFKNYVINDFHMNDDGALSDIE